MCIRYDIGTTYYVCVKHVHVHVDKDIYVQWPRGYLGQGFSGPLLAYGGRVGHFTRPNLARYDFRLPMKWVPHHCCTGLTIRRE